MRRASQLLDEHSDLLDMSGTYKRSLNGMVTLGAPIGIPLSGPLFTAAAAARCTGADCRSGDPQPRRTREKVRRSVRQRLRFADQLFQPQNESLIAVPFTRFRVGLFAAPDYIARSPLQRWMNCRSIAALPCACWAAFATPGAATMRRGVGAGRDQRRQRLR
ncbi:hypothetical protein M8494_01520 [Serratia ureilytica]